MGSRDDDYHVDVDDGDLSSALDSAVAFARTINSLGLKCGVSINPETPVAMIYPLLETGLVDLVDILAIQPGFEGQEFDRVAIERSGCFDGTLMKS